MLKQIIDYNWVMLFCTKTRGYVLYYIPLCNIVFGFFVEYNNEDTRIVKALTACAVAMLPERQAKDGRTDCMKRIATVPFQGTQIQEKELESWLAENKDIPGVAMAALQKAQEIYGYLPLEVQKAVAAGLNKPLAEIYGIATFYSQFSLSPKGKYRINVCMGTACYVKGSGKVLEGLEKKLGIKGGECTQDGKFSLDACRCIGACGLAPVLMINDDVYGRLTGDEKEIAEMLEKY